MEIAGSERALGEVGDGVVFRPPLGRWLRAGAGVLLGAGGCALIVFSMIRAATDTWLGGWGLLGAVGPGALLSVLVLAFPAVLQLAQGWRRWRLDPRGVAVTGPIGARFVAWGDVADFAMLPGRFPAPPDLLRLYSRDGEVLDIPLDLRPTPTLHNRLSHHFPALASHGLGRVRQPTGRPIARHPQAQRCYRVLVHIAGIALALNLGGVTVAIGWLISQDDRYYREHIRADPITKLAWVVEIRPAEDPREQVVRLRYDDGEGNDWETDRYVSAGFAERYGVGDRVIIEQRRGREQSDVAWVKGWDLNRPSWNRAVVFLAYSHGALAVAGAGLATVSLLRRSRWLRGPWSAWKHGGRWYVSAAPSDLEAMKRMLDTPIGPGTVGVFQNLSVLRRHLAAREHAVVPARWIVASRIGHRRGPKKALILDADAVREMFGRAGWQTGRILGIDAHDTSTQAQYALFEGLTPEQVEARLPHDWLVRTLGNARSQWESPVSGELAGHLVLVHDTPAMVAGAAWGPVDPLELPELFNRWVRVVMQRSDWERASAEALDTDFAELLGYPGGAVRFTVTFSEVRGTVSLYGHDLDRREVRAIRWESGRWKPSGTKRPPPRFLAPVNIWVVLMLLAIVIPILLDLAMD